MARTLQNTRILTGNGRGLQKFRGRASAPIFVPLLTVSPGTFVKHNDLTVGDRTLLDCSSAETSVDLKLAALSHIFQFDSTQLSVLEFRVVH